MHVRAFRTLVATVVIVLTVIAAVSFSPQARAATTLSVGITGRSSDDWALYVAKDTGIFASYGLDIDVVEAGSPVGATQQLIGGSIDVGSVTSTQMVEAVQGGAALVSLWVNINHPAHQLIGKKGITSVAQLKGKTVAVSGPAAITRVFADAILAGHGLKHDDVTFTYVAATNERYAALLSGGVDAALLLPPFSFRAIGQGYPLLDTLHKYYPLFPFNTYAASTTWLPAHHTEAVAFVKGIAAGVRWLYNPANKARAIKILTTETNTSDDDASKTYDQLITQLHAFPTVGTSTPADYQLVIDALVKLGLVQQPLPSPAKFYDNSYAEQAVRELNLRK